VTKDELIAFEADVAAEFSAGHIRAPIHLDGGNEIHLIRVFKEIKPTEWVLASWRSHYKALLHGVPPEKVRAEIMAGRSIALCFPEHRFLSSAIVGGILPIALGIALSIKRRGGTERVHAFIGDMTAATGIMFECMNYARNFSLPLSFIVEKNGKSVCTDTDEVWGWHNVRRNESIVQRFEYELTFPHAGAGKRVQF
jgi:pyruvate dehydrogenase E1 component alpha subunit